MQSHPLRQAMRLVGASRLSSQLGISYQAVHKWLKVGRMPRTEWTGETQYSARIAELTGNEVTRDQLLAPWPASGADNQRELRDAA